MKEKNHTCLLLTAFSGMARPVGKDSKTSESVANAESKVHEIGKLCVGGNGCIPDATALNPTCSSVPIHSAFDYFSELCHRPL